MQAMDAGVIPKAVDPANPNAAYLTPEIRRENSAWVGIETHGGTVTASEHNERTGGRYAFAVLLRMPEGRNAAINFIQKLGATPLEELQRAFSGRPTPRGTPGSRAPAPVMPKVEAGTQFAILRQMMVIDNTGHLVGTPITLSVEVRTFGPELQESFADFYVQRRLLLAGKAGGMVRRGPLEAANSDEFFNFEGLPVDSPAGGPRPTPVLQSCLRCHGLNPSVFPTLFNVLPYPSQIDTQSSPLPEFKQTAAFKSHRQEWGQLNQYWPNLVPVPMKVSIVRGPAISPIK